MSSISGNSTPSVQPQSTLTQTTTEQGIAATVDTIDSIDGGVGSVGLLPSNQVSIENYVATQGNLSSYFVQLFKNTASDNFLDVLKAAADILNNVPTAAEIQSTYDKDTKLLDNANQDISNLNSYNSSLNEYGAAVQTNGYAIQQHLTALQNANVSTTYASQNAQIQNLANQFEAGSISESQFTDSVQTILNQSSSTYNDLNSTFNEAANSYTTYNQAISNYQATVNNAPITQAQWNSDQAALNAANTANNNSGNFYPTLATLPNVTVYQPAVPATQTSIVNGEYNNSVSWPNLNNYSFTSVNSNNQTVVNTAQVNQLLSDLGASYSQANTANSGMQSTLSSFLTTDFTNQSAQIVTQQPAQQSPLAVPTFESFNSGIIQNYLAGQLVNQGSILNDFTNQNSQINPQIDSSAAQDQDKVNQLEQQMATEVVSVGLGAVAGASIVGIGGLASFSSITNSFINQSQNINQTANAQPTFSTDQTAFIKSTSNFLQTVVGASSILGTTQAYRDATNLLSTSPALNSSLLSLNTLESYNSILSTNSQADTLNQLAEQSSSTVSQANNQTTSGATDTQTLANEGALPFSLTTVGQRAVLVAQDVGGDKGSFTASYLAGFTQSALDAYEAQQGPLTSGQQQSVVQAQSSLVGLLTNNNVNFSFLQSNTSQTGISNAFQQAGQELTALGYNVSPSQLANAQEAFLTGLSSVSSTSATSVSGVNSLLQSAIAANVSNEIPPDVVANSVILHFDQNEESYRIQVKNEFQQTQTLNTNQVAHFSRRLKEAALGTAQESTIDALTQSTKVQETNFAEQLAQGAANQQENILGSQILEGTPEQIPGTDLLNNALVAKNDLTPVPTEKRTNYIPV
jgi:hypothetical protein